MSGVSLNSALRFWLPPIVWSVESAVTSVRIIPSALVERGLIEVGCRAALSPIVLGGLSGISTVTLPLKFNSFNSLSCFFLARYNLKSDEGTTLVFSLRGFLVSVSGTRFLTVTSLSGVGLSQSGLVIFFFPVVFRVVVVGVGIRVIRSGWLLSVVLLTSGFWFSGTSGLFLGVGCWGCWVCWFGCRVVVSFFLVKVNLGGFNIWFGFGLVSALELLVLGFLVPASL